MVSKILVALCIVVAAAFALPPPAGQPGAGVQNWGPGGGWGFGAGGFGPGVGGWGQGAGGWGQGVGGWGQGAGGWGQGAGGWGQGAGGGWGRGAGGWGQAAVNPWIPPWVSAFVPQRSQCSTIGSACVDCTSKAVCTPMGGFQSTCADPDFPYCNLGECSATPSAGCANVAVPEP